MFDMIRALTDTERPDPAPPDPVAPAQPSPAARAKAARKTSADGEPAQSYRSLLEHVRTLTRNSCQITGSNVSFDELAEPTATQGRVFELIGKPIPLRLASAEGRGPTMPSTGLTRRAADVSPG